MTLNNCTKKIHFIFPSEEIANSIGFSRLDLYADWYQSEFQIKKIDTTLLGGWLSETEVVVYAIDQEQVDSFVVLVQKIADEASGSFDYTVSDIDHSQEIIPFFEKLQQYNLIEKFGVKV